MECLDCYSFNGYRHLTEIAVTERNPYYCTENSVLFSKDRTQLIRYPAGQPASKYAIPDGVTSISKYAFYGCQNLQCITIPDSVKHFGIGAFLECSNLRKVVYGTAVIYTAGYNIARPPNVSLVQKLLEQGRFIKTANMMEKAIDLAVQHTQKGGSPEIQMYLMRYQKKHFPHGEKQRRH